MSKFNSVFSAAGFKLPFFGKGRSPLLSANVNDLVRALNQLGRITIKRNPATTEDRVIYADGGLVIEIAGNVAGASSTGSGMNYLGDYDSAENYVAGDVVRVRTGTSQGVYVAVQNVSAGTAPVFPEPGSPYWEILSLGVITTYEITDDPAAPIKTVYINASEGYL